MRRISRRSLLEYIRARCRRTDEGCWIWQGAVDNTGVPVFMLRGYPVRKVRQAAWEAAGRTFIAGRVFARPGCHERCCAPGHQLHVTRREAMQIAVARGSISSGARHAAAVAIARRKRSALTASVVAQVRARYAETGNAAAVAREFKLSRSHAHRLVRFEIWRDGNPFA